MKWLTGTDEAEESELMMLAVALYNYLAVMQVVEINLVF